MIHRLARASTLARQAFSLSTSRRMYASGPLTVGFIGLGNMGLPMCLNLVKKSKRLILAYDTDESAVAQAEVCGAQAIENLDEMAGCDLIFTMLPGDNAVNCVMPDLLKASSSPIVFCDCSTVSPTTSRHWNDKIQQAGAGTLMDAPVSGGVKGAQDGTLTFMVGANHGDIALDLAGPFLEQMGSRIVPCGGIGNGSATKLCNNLALATQMIGICEALNLGEALGVDPTVLTDVMNQSTAKCWSAHVGNPHPAAAASIKEATNGDVAPPSSKDYKGGFGARLMLKDLGLAVSAGQEAGVALPLGAASKELYRMAEQRGLGEKDFSVMLQFLKGK